MFEEDGSPAHICNKYVVHVSKAFAFEQECVKSDEELRKEQLTLTQHELDDALYVKNDLPTEEPAEEPADDDGYTYHLVEEYEDEERIDEDGDYGDDKSVQILLKVERRDDIIGGAVEQYNIEMSEAEKPTAVSANDQNIVQEEVFEYEVENDGSSQETAKDDSDEELDVIPNMVFRKNKKDF